MDTPSCYLENMRETDREIINRCQKYQKKNYKIRISFMILRCMERRHFLHKM